MPVVLGDDAGALLSARIEARDARWQLAQLKFNGGSLWVRDTGLPLGRAVRVRVLARDVSIALDKPGQTSIQNLLPCTVQAIGPDTHPSQSLAQLLCGESILLARVTSRAVNDLQLTPGMQVWAQVKSVALVE
jgi:molybdate transport system ATP-binding protein